MAALQESGIFQKLIRLKGVVVGPNRAGYEQSEKEAGLVRESIGRMYRSCFALLNGQEACCLPNGDLYVQSNASLSPVPPTRITTKGPLSETSVIIVRPLEWDGSFGWTDALHLTGEEGEIWRYNTKDPKDPRPEDRRFIEKISSLRRAEQWERQLERVVVQLGVKQIGYPGIKVL